MTSRSKTICATFLLFLLSSTTSGQIHPQQKSTHHTDTPTHMYEAHWNDTTAQWDSTARYTYTYFNDGKPKTEIKTRYTGPGTYQNDRRRTYTHTLTGDTLRSTYVEDDWNGSTWTTAFRYTEEHDGQDNRILRLSETWNGTAFDTTTAYRWRVTYTGSIPTEVIYQEWQFGFGYLNTLRDRYTLNAQNEVDSIFNYDYPANDWRLQLRTIDISWHDFANNQRSGYTEQIALNPGFENLYRYSRTYTTGDDHTTIREDWNLSAAWDTTWKFTHSYDQKGHEILAETFVWNNGTFDFLQGRQSLYTYDGQGRTTEYIFQLWDSTAYRNQLRRCWPDFFTGDKEMQSGTLTIDVFPNPATETLSLKGAFARGKALNFSLYDLQGRRQLAIVTARQSGQHLQFRLPPTLANGTYTYRLISGNRHSSGRIVIQR